MNYNEIDEDNPVFMGRNSRKSRSASVHAVILHQAAVEPLLRGHSEAVVRDR